MRTSKRKRELPLVYSILDSPAFGGAEQYLLSNLRFLSQRGYPVCLATNNQKVREQFENTIQQFKLKNFKIVQFPFVLDAIGNWKGLIKFFFWAPFAVVWQVKLFWQLKSEYSEIICYWAGFSDRLLLSPLAKLFHNKLIWIEIGPLEPTFKKTWGFPQFLYRLTQHFPDHFITTSLWTKKSMSSTGKVERNKIELIYPGVTFPIMKEVKKYKLLGGKWRKKHGYEKTFLISFIGRMAQENEVDVLLEALDYFHIDFHKNFVCLIIGDGPDKKTFESLTKSLNLAEKIIFTGFVSQKEKLSLVATSNLFVFARAWELDGFGMTPLEGMSVEVPVITTNFGPQKEIVADGKNGIRFVPHSAKDLAQKIQLLYSDASLRKKLAKEGRATLTPKFTETTMHQKTLEVIKKVQRVESS